MNSSCPAHSTLILLLEHYLCFTFAILTQNLTSALTHAKSALFATIAAPLRRTTWLTATDTLNRSLLTILFIPTNKACYETSLAICYGLSKHLHPDRNGKTSDYSTTPLPPGSQRANFRHINTHIHTRPVSELPAKPLPVLCGLSCVLLLVRLCNAIARQQPKG